MTGSPESKHQIFRAGILDVPTAEQTAAYLQAIIEHLLSPKCSHCFFQMNNMKKLQELMHQCKYSM